MSFGSRSSTIPGRLDPGSAFPELVEEGVVHFVGSHRSQPEFQILEHVEQLLPVDEFDREDAIPTGLSPRFA